MTETYGITLPMMMENAGRALAILARDRFFSGRVAGQAITVWAGSGGNGGGALTAARRLPGWRARVSLVLSVPAEAMTPVPALQLAILKRMGVVPVDLSSATPDLILDGLIGYSLRGAPRGRALKLIQWAKARPCRRCVASCGGGSLPCRYLGAPCTLRTPVHSAPGPGLWDGRYPAAAVLKACTVKAEIFTRPGCGYCVAAKQLLRRKNIPYTERDITHRDHWDEVKARVPKFRTVPQVFLNGRHIGGFDDLSAHFQRHPPG